MKIKINFICDINNILKDYIKHINNKNVLHIYFGKNFVINNNIDSCVLKKVNEGTLQKVIDGIKATQYYLDEELEKDLLIENYEWKICIGQENFMFDYPFTLEDVIFLPYNFIEESNMKFLIKTLFHEYIHVSQRIKPKIWEKHIAENTRDKYSVNWRKLKQRVPYENLNDIIIWNPDTYYDDNYVIEDNKKLYKAYLILDDNNGFTTKWFELSEDNFKPINKSIYKYEHPFEMLAYLLSNCIDKKQI